MSIEWPTQHSGGGDYGAGQDRVRGGEGCRRIHKVEAGIDSKGDLIEDDLDKEWLGGEQRSIVTV